MLKLNIQATDQKQTKLWTENYYKQKIIIPADPTNSKVLVSTRYSKGFPDGSDGYESACNAENLGSIPGFCPLEKGLATHSSIFAWRIPWTKEPGRL